MLKCLVIKYAILPMTEYVEIICPTKDATFLTYTVLRTDKHEQISVIVLINVKHFTLDESCQQIVFSDASGTGYDGYILETPITHGMWLDSEKGNLTLEEQFLYYLCSQY
jgi:hypothetical protein